MGIVIGPDGAAVRHLTSSVAEYRESITDVARQIEDLNWVNLSTDRVQSDMSYDDRKRLLQRIRLYRRRNPLAKQAANLLQHYVLGQGISLKANNKALVARIVDEFWEDPTNQAVFTSHQSQKEALDGLFTDGDMFLVLFPNREEGTVQLGILDAMLVEDVITDPDNARVPRWYKARRPSAKFDYQNGTWINDVSAEFVYYRDWRNDDETGGPAMRQIADGIVYHVRINRRGKFGESELATAVDWLKSHKDFMEDRVSLNRAAAQVAWKKKRKGGANDIAAEVARLQSSMVNNLTRYESNPPSMTASTVVENDGTSLDWMKTDTGGANALSDERILRMMAGSGMGGIPNHYFGDEANANLATATAMELPLLKTYEDWQRLWSDVIEDLIGFVLTVAHEAERIGPRDDSSRYAERIAGPTAVLRQTDVADMTGQSMAGSGITRQSEAATGAVVRDPALAITLIGKSTPMGVEQVTDDTTGSIDWFVDVDFPPIITKDLGDLLNGLKTFYEFLPTKNLESQKLVVELALGALGQNNIDEVMERLFPPGMDAEVDQPGAPGTTNPTALTTALKGLLGPGPTSPGEAAGATVSEDARVAESLAEYRVRRVLRAARDAQAALTG